MQTPAYQFPKDFMWGAIASAYQIEGAWDEDGKGESIWDRFCQLPDRILNAESGQTADDHYHRMPADVALMKEIGLDSYSFTISWPRVIPQGIGIHNPAGWDFYDRLVDALLEAGIKPKATLYHWDLPAALQERGGWMNRDCLDWFADYAAAAFQKLADRVDLWATHNEPWVVAFLGYGAGIHAPGICDASKAYQVAHHLLLAHARAVDIFHTSGQRGEIGLILNLNHTFPATDREEDLLASRRVYDETHSLWLDPLVHGRYPEQLLEWLGPNRPQVLAGDLAAIQGRLDYLGINHYNTDRVSYDHFGGWLKARLEPYSAPGFGQTQMGWGINPAGLKAEVLNVHHNYGQPKILLTENGCAALDIPDERGYVDDLERIRFLRAHIIALHQAIQEGADVKGYFVWSILDNFEWERGYSMRFGLVRVDPESLERIPKHSAAWYSEVIARNGVSA